jgi:cell wall-associated NlpC family hydrolase
VGLASLAGSDTAAAEPSIADKQAEAQSVLAQIQEIDGQLGAAIEAWNGARYRLSKIEGELETNAHHLKVARSSLKASQKHLAERLVALYVNGSDASAMEVLLGAESLDDLLSQLDTVSRVSEQDARVLGQVKSFRTAVQVRKAKLQRARAAQKREVAELAARRSSIESQLQERERMLASIKDQIAALEAAEAQRQARLAAEARRRVAALAQSNEAEDAQALPTQTPVEALPDGGENPVDVDVAVSAAPPARYGGVVGIAMQYLGVPYRWGGADPSGFDCSGFSMYVYAQVGVSLPHHAASQYGMGSPVAQSDLQAGDLVFFNGLGHMGIYIGGGSFIHAPHTGDVVKISSLGDSWYASTYVGARRI